MNARVRLALCFVQLAVWLSPLEALQAQDQPKRSSIWDIHIGDGATDIPNEFAAYACGTNGGPPSTPLAGFAEFKKCKPEASGLREVYFEYDDELEYWARALELKAEIRMYAGTTVYEFPIVASVLFDDAGRARGVRMATDPRQHTSRRRIEFWTLANFLRQRFGEDDWICKDLPPNDGETPAGSLFIKNRCEKMTNGLHLILEQRYLQKKGQRFVDTSTGETQTEPYESGTRFEMYDAAVPVPNTSVN